AAGCADRTPAPSASTSVRRADRAPAVCLLSIFSFPITTDAVVKDTADVASEETAQSFQFELDKDAGIVFFDAAEEQRVVVDPFAGDYTQVPAAVAVFDAAQGFEVALVGVIVVPASDHAPLVVYRPYGGNVRL